MASFVVGYGGKVTKVGSPNVDLCVSKWAFTDKVEVSTLSLSCGRFNLPGVPSVEGTIELPFDEDNTPEDAGVVPGVVVTVRFYVGTSGLYYDGTVLINQRQMTNDNGQGQVASVVLSFMANLAIGTTTFTLH